MSARGQEPTNLDFVSIRALRDITRWTQFRSERDTTWSHWRRRREVENMALLASAARRAARTTAIQKAFRFICSQRTKKYDENGLNSFNSVEQISSERQSTVHITRCARGILKKVASPENQQFSWKEWSSREHNLRVSSNHRSPSS